jgi:hypothetical protein
MDGALGWSRCLRRVSSGAVVQLDVPAETFLDETCAVEHRRGVATVRARVPQGPAEASGGAVTRPPHGSPRRAASLVAALVNLQRSAGNRAVTAYLQRDGPVEVDLVPVTTAERERLAAEGIQLPTVSPGTAISLGASPYQTILPGYSQAGDSCGAASLVTALLIWDREHWDPEHPNSRAVAAALLVQDALEQHGAAAAARWAARPADAVRKQTGGDAADIQATYQELASDYASELSKLRVSASAPGAAVSEADYQVLGYALYFLWHEGSQPGITSTRIHDMQTSLGLRSDAPSSSASATRLADLLSDPVATGLQPDQMAQVAWFTRAGHEHVFLIGRLQTGEWMLSDQGQSPPFEPRADSMASLRSIVLQAMESRTSWLHPGTTKNILNQTKFGPGTVEVTLLGSSAATRSKARDLIAPGDFLGEVDAGVFTFRDRLTRGEFAGQADTPAAGQAMVSDGPGSGVVIERPAGVFTAYRATAVSSDANLAQTGFDVDDSSGGALMGRRFLHAWLLLGTQDGRKGRWLNLY